LLISNDARQTSRNRDMRLSRSFLAASRSLGQPSSSNVVFVVRRC